jgi:hypothetical protein
VAGGAGADTLTANAGHVVADGFETVTANNATIVDFENSQVMTSLSLNDTSKLNQLANGGHFIDTAGISLSAGATLDMFDNDMIVRSTAGAKAALLTTLSGLIGHARNTGGYWVGTGITSTTAKLLASRLTGLAILLNEKVGGGAIHTSFDGQVVNVDCVMLKYTWNGDADLSGKNDANDYFLIDSGFAAGATGYRNGDFDYSTHVDANDYFLIDSAFAGQVGVLSGGKKAAAVRKPAGARVVRGRHHKVGARAVAVVAR